ncbi:MAG: VCBS repeat-containing protein [Bacteroidota bacterium]
MRRTATHIAALVLVSLLGFSCSDSKYQFEKIEPNDSGIWFSNTIQETESLHYFNYPYIYTGGGIGIGDFDKDGLQDVFFTSNMGSNALYRNLGDMTFEEITEQAGLTSQAWSMGVSIVDVNQDGWLDIYVCVSGMVEPEQRRNLLYINNQDLSFTESADQYGIADQGHSTQAAFFDYDRDGDLDLYIMTHANESYAKISKLYTYTDGAAPSTDRLYENLGTDSLGHPLFQNASAKAGILTEGYGLGLAISDLNQDGWPDIYVANDFIASDLLYINQQDGTFKNLLSKLTQHTSQNGMGVDIADVNNDGLSDIMVMDMLPESNHRQKTMTANMNYDYFKRTLAQGFSPQFIMNTLQVHRGIDDQGLPAFSELGRMAGVYQTDWSWAPLFADFDQDGMLDLYITNGFRRDVTDHDFQEYHEQSLVVEQGTGELAIPKVLEQLARLDSVCLPNYLFHNQGDLQFIDQTKSWGLAHASMSNGAAYTDLDNDGDLDLLTNNLNAPAFLYENKSNIRHDHHFLWIKLEGPKGNRQALGAKIIAELPDGRQLFREHYQIRGYLSSVQSGIHLGLGADSLVASLKILWPNGDTSVHENLKADSIYHVQQAIGNKAESPSKVLENKYFQNIPDRSFLSYTHEENANSDFKLEPLLAHLYDFFGPGVAVGDLNGDGREDLCVGGARGQASMLFFQKADGSFASQELPDSERYEDMGSLIFDADLDGDQDVYIVSGGSSVKYFQKGHYQDRLYVNDGTGTLQLAEDLLPDMPASGSCVIGSDWDQDGDMDLFVGGRIVPGKFPTIPPNYLLENREGTFFDVTEELAPGLRQIGMVSAALWTDVDQDQDSDLLLVGEWMPITLFRNEATRFHKAAVSGTSGWWNSLVGADMDLDGDIDYVAGNLGANTAYKANSSEPVRVYAKDFDQNGAIDAILTRYISGKEYPLAPRGAMIGQLEAIRRLFPQYKGYSEADIHQILAPFDTSGMQILEAHSFHSAYIENLGSGEFAIHSLPQMAQLAPTFGLAIEDVNGDGLPDIMGVGNFRPTEVLGGWYDAHKGCVLLGDGKGQFQFEPGRSSGFWVEAEARALVKLRGVGGKNLYIVSVNDDRLKGFQKNQDASLLEVQFMTEEIRADIHLPNGHTRSIEQYWGQGYLSQSSRYFQIEKEAISVSFYDKNGLSRSLVIKEKDSR